MKFKIILIVSLFLAILTVGTVSAADVNVMSDDMVAQEDSVDEMEIIENVLDEVLTGEDINLYVDCPTTIHSLGDECVYISTDNNPKCKLSIFVDGHKEYTGVLKDNHYYFDSSLKYGKHSFNVTFQGDNKYDPCSYSTTFYYSYLEVGYENLDMYYDLYNKHGEGLHIISPLKMDAKVYVDNKLVFDGKLKDKIILLNNLTLGNHRYKIATQGNGKKYTALTVEGTFERVVRPIIVYPELMIAGNDKKLTFELPGDADGNLEILFNDVDVNATLTNGKASVFLKNLETGEYIFDIAYTGDSKYEDYYCSSSKIIIIPNPNFNFIPATTIKEGVKTKVIVTGIAGLEGEIEISGFNEYGEEETYYGSFIDGNAVVPITFYKLGSDKIKYTFKYEYYGPELEGSFDVGVFLKKALLTAGDFKANYKSKTKYKVRVKDIDNKYAAGKTVTFELYKYDIYKEKIGKKVTTKTAKSDKNGYAKISFDVAPGQYRVKVKYGDAAVTKKYIVKSIIKVNKVLKHKKDTVDVTVTSKTIKIGATLKKVDGKYLKGKKIKFEFYGYKYDKFYKIKTYTAKTNSKGIASLTFKKSPVKVTAEQMIGGGGFSVKIIYLKDTVWTSFSIYSKSPFRYYFI